MAKLDGLKTVLDFLKGLQPKIAAQIAKKVLALNIEPLPSDSQELSGYTGYYRVDCGEYRTYIPHFKMSYFNTSRNITKNLRFN